MNKISKNVSLAVLVSMVFIAGCATKRPAHYWKAEFDRRFAIKGHFPVTFSSIGKANSYRFGYDDQ